MSSIWNAEKGRAVPCPALSLNKGRRARGDERGTGLLGRGRHLLQRQGAGDLRAEVQELRAVRILSAGEEGRGGGLCPVRHIADEVTEMS
jgi:hypothetical protein